MNQHKIGEIIEQVGDIYEFAREEIIDGNMNTGEFLCGIADYLIRSIPSEYFTDEEVDIICDLLADITERI